MRRWSARRRACDRIVRALDIPDPFDTAELCRRVAATRGRPIHLLPMDIAATGLSGLWLATRGADYIIHERGTSAPHRDHVVLHELGHILCEHTDGDPAVALFPQLDPDVVRTMLGRGHDGYSTGQEAEAEYVAYAVQARARGRPRAGGGGDDMIGRLGRALED